MDFEGYLETHGTPAFRAQGDHVFRQGDDSQGLYFIRAGFLKAYYVTEDGAVQIKSFLSAGMVIGSLAAAFEGEAATFNLECLEDCVLVHFSFDHLRTLARENPSLAATMTEFLLALALKKERREYEFLCLSAEERYRRLRDRSPGLFDRVTQQDIALYLGVTPVALSRIKKRVGQATRSAAS